MLYGVLLNSAESKPMRKTILIIISTLLSSYLLVSCQKEDDVLYRGGTGKIGFEWKTFGDEKTQPKYRGEISDGEPNGLGTLTLPNGENYLGEWENGKRNGQGIHLSPDGKKYEGEWKNDKKHGKGTETYPDSSKYVGEFKNGKKLRKKLLSGISPLSE